MAVGNVVLSLIDIRKIISSPKETFRGALPKLNANDLLQTLVYRDCGPSLASGLAIKEVL